MKLRIGRVKGKNDPWYVVDDRGQILHDNLLVDSNSTLGWFRTRKLAREAKAHYLATHSEV